MSPLTKRRKGQNHQTTETEQQRRTSPNAKCIRPVASATASRTETVADINGWPLADGKGSDARLDLNHGRLR